MLWLLTEIYVNLTLSMQINRSVTSDAYQL